MHDMDPAALRAFVTVAETGAFTLAAERLHLTQPAVSRRIQALEQRLGVALFDRLPRRVILTEAGRRLLPPARRALEALEGCLHAVEGGGTVSGTLSLGTSHHIGLHYLPEVLRGYHRRHPQVHLALSFLGSEAALRGVEEGELEIALVTLPPASPPGLTLIPLWEDPLELVVARDHPLTRMDAMEPSRLSQWPAVLPEEGTATRRLIDSALTNWGVKTQAALASNHLEILRMLVGAGLGWSLLPRTLRGEDLVALPLPHPLRRRLGAAHHARRRLSQAAQAFLALLPNQAGAL